MASISNKVDEIKNEAEAEDKDDSTPDEPDPDPDLLDNPYYFESDHAALKCNPDYHSLLKTLCLLEAQRIRVIQDIDMLYVCQKEALENPLLFVEKLQRGKGFNFPRQQMVAKLPSINWEAYTSRKDISSYYTPKHMTRQKKTILDSYSTTNTNEDNSEGSWKSEYSNTSRTVVRGRLKDENKPTSFNQLWSIEEQKRLEELLVKYPPEEVESRRWQKIAICLGNRTTQQVASRVQKYFIKLARAGLPVPGRTPNLTSLTRRTGHRHHRFNRFYHQSTFLQAHEPPVYMSDDDDDDDDSSMSVGGSSYMETDVGYPDDLKDVSDEESVLPKLRDTEEYKELMKLKKMKVTHLQSSPSNMKSSNYKCDNCQCSPIMNTRWQCIDCQKDGTAIDLCNNCVDSNFENSVHNCSHRLQPVNPQGFVDNDYTKFSTGDYNYLDPNYMPAN